jgi:hypothetical protein
MMAIRRRRHRWRPHADGARSVGDRAVGAGLSLTLPTASAGQYTGVDKPRSASRARDVRAGATAHDRERRRVLRALATFATSTSAALRSGQVSL